jgi:uncharacterized membrane protein YccC
MKKTADEISIGFNTAAQQLLADLFKAKVKLLNRQYDENVFRQLQGRYQQAMQQQLETIARQLIAENTLPAEIPAAQKNLMPLIELTCTSLHKSAACCDGWIRD